jgi:hypothetical protein
MLSHTDSAAAHGFICTIHNKTAGRALSLSPPEELAAAISTSLLTSASAAGAQSWQWRHSRALALAAIAKAAPAAAAPLAQQLLPVLIEGASSASSSEGPLRAGSSSALGYLVLAVLTSEGESAGGNVLGRAAPALASALGTSAVDASSTVQ